MKKLKGLVKVSGRSGFTLVELLIVVIILAVLAAIVVPQFSSSSEEAREAALRSTLTEMRNAIELYYHQHNNTYPGAMTNGATPAATTDAAGAQAAFLNQLTRYSDVNGTTAATRDPAATPPIRFGPYLKRDDLPTNPIDASQVVTYVLDGAANAGDLDQPGAVVGTSGGWWFDVVSGKFIANTAGTGLDGTAYITW